MATLVVYQPVAGSLGAASIVLTGFVPSYQNTSQSTLRAPESKLPAPSTSHTKMVCFPSSGTWIFEMLLVVFTNVPSVGEEGGLPSL